MSTNAPPWRMSVRAKRQAIWWSLRLADALAPRKSSANDRVLLVAPNRLMADYVIRLWRCVADVHPGGVAITAFDGMTAEERSALETSGIEIVSAGRARWRRWRVLLLADHAPLQYLPSIPRAIVPHGVARARHVREGSYYYDPPRLFWPDGKPVYAVMLDASEASATWARERFPQYRDRIIVTGDLRIDELVDHATDARSRRRALGWQDRTVIGVMSTWSQGALIPTMGEWLVPYLRRLVEGGAYAVVLTMHPNLWDASRCGTEQWACLVRAAAGPNFKVVPPEDDWASSLALADCVLTDHTSLAATWSVLRRPMIPVEVPPSVIGEDTFAGWLLATRQPVRDAATLDRALAELPRYADFDGVPSIVDHLGEAQERTRRAISRLVHS